ncbi:MAG TPA: hypothetical protein VM577_11175 [Anaerovoracaceae bacterium]|nr:hypothetical protein [Anaerovoracaceae bacterium]
MNDNNKSIVSFICPQPERWNSIYNNLIKAYEEKTGRCLGKTTSEIHAAGGPPTPLILNGWYYSTDEEKHQRWLDTIQWAQSHNLDRLLIVEEPDKCYYAGLGDIEPEYIDSFTTMIFEEYKLKEYVTEAEYRENPRETVKIIPAKPGIYFVFHEYQWPEDCFMEEGSGGWYKGKTPNVSIEELWLNWVENAEILYIGKAGGTSKKNRTYKTTLKRRLTDLLKSGNRKPAPHWGGRYLWQHEGSANFRVYWYETSSSENPVELEKILIEKFKQIHNNKRPFANLED